MLRSHTIKAQFPVEKTSVSDCACKVKDIRTRNVTVITTIERNPYEDFIFKKSQVKQFAGCGHICVPTWRQIDGITYADECRVCASMYKESQLESSIRRGKMKILVPIGSISYSSKTINMYYCAHANIHADDCACISVSCAPASCSIRRKKSHQLPRTKSCSQVFFACEDDLFECTGKCRGGLLQCWNAHLSDDYPIYKCITAVLLTYGLRFDNALPIYETTVPIAYNAQYKIAIVCYKNDQSRAEVENILHALGTLYVRAIFSISYREVNELLPMSLFGHRREYSIACNIMESFVALAQQIMSNVKDRESVAQLTPESYVHIIKKIQSGRLIDCKDVETPAFRALTIDDYKESSELIRPEPCEYETIPNVRMRRACSSRL